MRHFVFSADSHIREPADLFLDGLPAKLKPWAIHHARDDTFMYTKSGDRVLHRMRINDDGAGGARRTRAGFGDLKVRLADMAADGVDAEICFPSLGLVVYFLEDPEVEYASAQIYNDWNHRFFEGHMDRFVRCAVLPVRDVAHTLAELKRVAALGFTAAMLPVVTPPGAPKYNDERWDPIFRAAGELGVVFVLHTGTGLASFVQERGPGGAVVNYARQMNDGIDAVMMLTAGGVLDRNPDARIAVIEAGASWLAALAERMDEVYEAHHVYVRPKLSVLPSEVIRRQVACSFQHDKACIQSRHVTGTQALMFATDYPHMEGTFPHSRAVVDKLFDGADIHESEKAAILGGNALKLFRQPQPSLLEPAAP